MSHLTTIDIAIVKTERAMLGTTNVWLKALAERNLADLISDRTHLVRPNRPSPPKEEPIPEFKVPEWAVIASIVAICLLTFLSVKALPDHEGPNTMRVYSEAEVR